MKPKIGIIGAGIGGLTLAKMLNDLELDSTVFEASETVRGIGAGIGLASNAIKAFEYLDLEEGIVQISNPIDQFDICNEKGEILVQADTSRISKKYNKANYAVHRADLHQFLLSQLDANQIETSKEFIDIQVDSKVRLKFKDNSIVEFDYVIGADGVNSKVRQFFLPKSKPRYAGYWCWRGVVHLENWKSIHKNSETWGRNGRFGISPLSGKRVYWYACVNSDMNDGVDKFGLEELKKLFQNYHRDIPMLLDLTDEKDVISTPIVDIKPISRFNFSDKVLLIGDAAHATTPNMGQGACMAIEDVAVLQDELMKNDFPTAFRNFENRRLDRTKYITDTSWIAGKMAQSENSLAIYLRNNFLKYAPDSIAQIQLNRLMKENFMKI
ncbi:FAD-dependent monooxygenase [Moheibacter lacus]|uniref:FAD-dependent monooxygenase n=1 Tax=Moheibacter lacus TaxID=2745851 RepID=A0A838ZJP8_9FLAO|nr:FAD-dependent monooxygenase [Moheibacter lacus]MBA5629861.1 FAD-dependent monooxygenase [Moheibacter lacus]